MIKASIPNILTSLNLLCGCIAIVLCFEGNLIWATYVIWIAMIFDFLDGFAARLLGVSSPIGKELDSLADMVTFGVVPSIMLFQLIKAETANDFLPYIGFLVAVFSALRLAKFNIDDRQTTVFIGLPTPANALFISSLVFINATYSWMINTWTLVAVALLFSLLLVAPLELFALKFKSYSFKNNEIKLAFLILSVLCLVIFKLIAIPLVILLYILLSIVKTKIVK